MTIASAIENARKCYEWLDGVEATSVLVGFNDRYGGEQEVELDLYCDNKITELEELFASLADEFETTTNSINYVNMLGYIE